jgi:hypothetical protein
MDPKASGGSNTSDSSNSTGGGQDNKDINKSWKGVLSQLQLSTSVSSVDTWITEGKFGTDLGPRSFKIQLTDPLNQDWKLCI